MGSFIQRKLDITFTLIGDTFDTKNGADVITYKGLRILTEITNPPQEELNKASIKVYGMSTDVMNRLTRMLWAGAISGGLPNDIVTISAGTNDSDMSVVFTGNILSAYTEYNNAPDVPFIILAQTVLINSMVSQTVSDAYKAVTYRGETQVSIIAEKIAKDMGLSFENNGVTSIVTDQYLWNTPLARIKRLSSDGHFDFYIDGQTLAITPKLQCRATYDFNTAPIISPETGLVGWPTSYLSGTIKLTTLYNKYLVHGALIKVDTMVKAVNDESANIGYANGYFYILNMTHYLESELPNGVWFTEILATRVLNSPVI